MRARTSGRVRARPRPRDRRGAWSQTVWQVDDSPALRRRRPLDDDRRRARAGRATGPGGRSPAATRSARPRYDRYLAINRHAPTPDGGWIHWQDNEKMGLVDGAARPLRPGNRAQHLSPVHRVPAAAAADRYWAATRDYWAAVRAEWTRVERAPGGIRIQEEAQTGNVISRPPVRDGQRDPRRHPPDSGRDRRGPAPDPRGDARR